MILSWELGAGLAYASVRVSISLDSKACDCASVSRPIRAIVQRSMDRCALLLLPLVGCIPVGIGIQAALHPINLSVRATVAFVDPFKLASAPAEAEATCLLTQSLRLRLDPSLGGNETRAIIFACILLPGFITSSFSTWQGRVAHRLYIKAAAPSRLRCSTCSLQKGWQIRLLPLPGVSAI